MSSSDASDDDGLAALVGAFAKKKSRPAQPLELNPDDAAPAHPFAHALHQVTAEPSTGLGAQLAGTTDPSDDLWMPDSMSWDATSSSSSIQTTPLLPPHVAARVELRRAAKLTELHALFRERLALPSPPINALERWRFLCKWQQDEPGAPPSDALLPSGPPKRADAALAADLRRAGLDAIAADELVTAMRAASSDAAQDVARLRDELVATPPPSDASLTLVSERLPGGVLQLRLASTYPGATYPPHTLAPAEAERSVRVTEACVGKLRALYTRHGTADDAACSSLSSESAFDLRLFALLLRYDAIGGAGFQAALGGPVMRGLQSALSVNFECFASPLNCYYGHFCSAFPDVDLPFGSRGSFANFVPTRGSFEANPPFVDGIIDASSDQMLQLLDTAQAASEPLCFAVVLPGWADSPGYNSLLRSPLLRRTLLIAAADHGYVDGAQHTRPRSYRAVQYDTRLFVLQSDAHAAAHPLDDGAMATLEKALAECTPKADGPPAPAEAEASSKQDAPACLRAVNPRKRRRGGKKR